MPKRLKQFIYNSLRAALILGVVMVVYDQIGPALTGDYFNLIWWGIQLFSVGVIIFITVRLCTGLHSGRLLFDDYEDQ